MRNSDFPFSDLVMLLYGAYGEQMIHTVYEFIVFHPQAFQTIAYIAIGVILLHAFSKK